MHYEYLIFNIIVISGPLFFGSMKKFYFLNYWRESGISIFIAAVPFLIWDSLVTGMHWDFNSNYILGYKIFGLPIEEISFFITVPFACLFTWEMVKRHSKKHEILNWDKSIIAISLIFIAGGVVFLFIGKGYTGLAFLIMGLCMLYDFKLGAQILKYRQFIFFFVLISLFTLVFNGYLTWRPVVTYGEQYQLGFRIFTIPFEDFIFGYALLILSTTIFERLVKLKVFTDNEPAEKVISN
ncbi:MAG: lycopene cyclase domain-containing protein [Ignavibacteriae bacterium]|nr:lycopene cyclase domain-containing protein [Ignavibacteriota bacterium]NOG99216.1 lycopene cyclase domain-containing protein [Ignavibacteriota bacterium]